VILLGLLRGLENVFCAITQISRKGIMRLCGKGVTQVSGKGFTQTSGKGKIKDHLQYSMKMILGLKGTIMLPNYSSAWVTRYA